MHPIGTAWLQAYETFLDAMQRISSIQQLLQFPEQTVRLVDLAAVSRASSVMHVMLAIQGHG